MHELTIAYSTLEIIEQNAKLNDAKQVTQVWMEIGAFSCVEAQSLQFCFETVCQGTIAENCKLHLIQSEPKAWCESCQKEVIVESERVFICPECGSSQITLLSGSDVCIKRLEVI